jgi:hypothetical protein
MRILSVFFCIRYCPYPAQTLRVVAVTNVAVRASLSSGHHSLVFRSAPTGHACSLSAAKLGQSCSMWAGVWMSVPHGTVLCPPQRYEVNDGGLSSVKDFRRS